MSSTEIASTLQGYPLGNKVIALSIDTVAWTPFFYKPPISKDSVPIPRKQLINAIRAKDSLDIMKAEVSEKDKEIETLYTGKSLDSLLIIQLNTTIGDGEAYTNTIKKQNANLSKQNDDLAQLNANCKSDLKKAKWTIVKTAGISSVIISGITYLVVRSILKHN